MAKFKLLSLMLLSVFMFGCSHHLEIRNLNAYQASSMTTLSRDISVGIITPNDNSNGQVLVSGAAQALSNYVGKIIYPYSPSHSQDVDVVSKITVKSHHKGSGANFFINFPGFLVWAPAWNGYVYKTSYDVDVSLLDSTGQSIIDTFSIPITLDVRHADIDRTWTEVSWFEVGVIGLVGGAVFVQYDDDVTPLVENEAKTTLGDYLAQEIAKRLGDSTGYRDILIKKQHAQFAPAGAPTI